MQEIGIATVVDLQRDSNTSWPALAAESAEAASKATYRVETGMRKRCGNAETRCRERL